VGMWGMILDVGFVAVGMGYYSDKDCSDMDCSDKGCSGMDCFGMGSWFGMGYFGLDFPIVDSVVVIVEVGPIEALVVDHCRFCCRFCSRFGFHFRTSRIEGLGSGWGRRW
jgi:hypothetical protein